MQENTILDKIDSTLSSKSASGRYVYYIISFTVAFTLIYLALYDMSEEFLSTNSSNLVSITSKLTTEQGYISENEPKIKIMEQNIQNNSNSLASKRETNSYLDDKLKELSYLLFNDQSWANFMDRLTYLAKQYSVNILKIENNFLDEKEEKSDKNAKADNSQNSKKSKEVRQILNVDVASTGNFHSIIKFLNAIEESQLVVDVYNSTISSSNKSNSVDSNFQIAVWGMLY